MSRRVLLENIASNYLHVIVMGVTLLVSMPIFVRILGPTQWGVVALCITAQGILLLLDIGLGSLLPREIARYDQSGRAKDAYYAFVRIYGSIALVAFLGGQLLAPQIVSLLPAETLEASHGLELALRLVLTQFLFQFPNNAATGYWIGTEQQKRASLRQIFFGLLKYCSALLSVSYWSATALGYLLPFVLVSVLEATANFYSISVERRPAHTAPQALSVPAPSITSRHLVGEMGTLSVALLLGLLASQVDRLFLARTVSTELFGTYIAVATLALTLMHLQSPIQRAYLPRIIKSEAQTYELLREMITVLILVCTIPCFALAAFARPVLMLWLNNARMADDGAVAFQLISVSVGLNAIFSAFFTLIVRHSYFRALTLLNAAILICQSLFLFYFADFLSISAGGWSWFICAVFQLAFCGFFVAAFRRKRDL